MNEYIAHVRKDEKTDQWLTHNLSDHLQEVAKRAEEFAQTFGSGDWVRLAGLWHDLGKFNPQWQAYIRRETGYDEDGHLEGYSGRPNHSTSGAVLALERFKESPLGRILAYLIAGHHAGLPDWNSDSAGGDLQNRLYDTAANKLKTEEISVIRKLSDVQQYLTILSPKTQPLQCISSSDAQRASEHLHLWIRMLFSCLVDADFLDTEKFMTPSAALQRRKYPTLEELTARFDAFMEMKEGKAQLTSINQSRAEILKHCRAKAELPPGFFSLTVPTGGGKTLSSMAFALRHALRHNKKRVIMAIPYTSIIEQTAAVYKEIFGEVVIEHHSNLDLEKETRKSRLASENWDAPIIVTTNVQLFESLFASRTSSCRKLHNIVDSVIILDEAQMLPPEYLRPILSVLRGLVEYFGVTVVLCTATQPAFNGKIGSGQAVFDGLSQATEIIGDTPTFIKAFKRCEIFLPDMPTPKDWNTLAGELIENPQVLCIVNTRRDCQELHRLMPKGTFHLSANMCGEERSEVIADIKKRLFGEEPVRVISTQLIEAGVDIDFPVVYRALAGIDSIAQAAGRCNREGKLNTLGQMGRVVVFFPPKSVPTGLLRKSEDAAKSILPQQGLLELQQEVYKKYFESFYRSVNDFDKPGFFQRLVSGAGEAAFQFRSFAKDIRLIDDSVQKGIIVYYDGMKNSSIKLIDQLRRNGPEPWLMRKLQRFIVNIPLRVAEQLVREEHIEDIHGYYVQKSTGLYQRGYGLLPDPQTWAQELFIVG